MTAHTNLAETISQRLVFFLGKGGVGRTTLATSFAQACALRGEKTLIVQWSLNDAVSSLFSRPSAGHDSSPLAHNLWVMNFSADEAIREYFIDHLKLRLVYNLVIENKHVQRLLHAAPGVRELFFLGRLFWLICLSEEIRGTRFDRVVVDAQATGHGVSLFTIAPTIAKFGMTGPLAAECERVASMLADPKLVGTALVTLPEELPVEETLEFLPKLTHDLGRSPNALLINRSIAPYVEKNPQSMDYEHVVGLWEKKLTTNAATRALALLHRDLRKRQHFEMVLRDELKQRGYKIAITSVPDIGLAHPESSASTVLHGVADWLVNANEKILENDEVLQSNRQQGFEYDISEDQR
ncbi:MAG: ArsA family ATPase [Betaproteobacteria bacterium]|nr:ArsA family ATPase [Betaproteobacteria bacterium]